MHRRISGQTQLPRELRNVTDTFRPDPFRETVAEKNPITNHSVRKPCDDDLMISPERIPRLVSSEDATGRFQQVNAPPGYGTRTRGVLAAQRRNDFETV